MLEHNVSFGVWSLLPLGITLLIAFKTKSAAFSLLIGCFIGAFMIGINPARGFSSIAQIALGNSNFIWICLIIFLIGILFELFKFSGVISEFTKSISKRFSSSRGVQFAAWLMGFFIIDDYFSPLMSGVVLRPLSDKAKISREKLAFILDSTTASVCVLFPFAAWGAYISGLVSEQALTGGDVTIAFNIFLNSIIYNFYPILLVFFTLGITLKFIPDFGPMKKAEKRAYNEGKVIRDGGTPLISNDTQIITGDSYNNVSLFYELIIPIMILVGIAFGSLIISGSVKIVEAFIYTVIYVVLVLFIKRKLKSINQLMEKINTGIKNVMQAVIIISLAYCINSITKELGATEFIVEFAKDWLTPTLLVAVTFILTSLISFSTGSSWGAYAIMIPFSLPIAFAFTNGNVDPLIYKCVAAVAGGGVFGDHASPVSDTSVLASTGAGSDHMDHVITQIPYALVIAGITTVLYLIF